MEQKGHCSVVRDSVSRFDRMDSVLSKVDATRSDQRAHLSPAMKSASSPSPKISDHGTPNYEIRSVSALYVSTKPLHLLLLTLLCFYKALVFSTAWDMRPRLVHTSCWANRNTI